MADTTPTPPAAPAVPPLKKLAFAFPFRKKTQGAPGSSADFTGEHEFYRILKDETSGTYPVSAKGMWHGGIHVTEAGAGSSLDLKYGVRCLADGEVVAWRVNRAYPVSELPARNGTGAISAPYSTGFTLVRHSMEFPRGTPLTFYSLYMHLQDLADYESDTTLARPAYWSKEFKVTEFAQDPQHPAPGGQTAPAGQVGLRIRATRKSGTILGILPQGSQVVVGARKDGWGQIKDSHGATLYPPVAGGFVSPDVAINGWIFLGKENGGPVVTEVMPDSSLDQVVVLAEPFRIKAGELIGHLGRYDSLSQQTSNRMVHLEVFCDDSIRTFITQGQTWIADHGAHEQAWQQLGLSKDPTILRVDKNTTLYGLANQQGQDAKQTGVIQVASFAELARQPGNPVEETTAGSDGQKLNWWHVDSADALGNDISGWVREDNFASGRVTREFAQKWVDFQPLEDPHDPTHTMFATTRGYVDYSIGAPVPDAGSLDKLSPLMQSIYEALSLTGDSSQAADRLCDAANHPWIALRMSRLIIKHESEWANPDKWKQLVAEIETQTGPQPQHEAEQQRIEKLVWWDEVKAALADLPASDVFHIHPVALVANFASKNLVCKRCGARITLTREFLRKIAPTANAAFVDELVRASTDVFPNYGVNSCRQIKHLLAQAKVETTRFSAFRESLNYVSYTGGSLYNMAPTAINNGFARKHMTFGTSAAKIAWIQDHLIANDAAYGEHCFGTNEQPGKDFRGRGLLQLTFYETYKRCAQATGYPIDSQPELVENNPGVVIETGLWFWSDREIGSIADNPTTTGDDGVKKVTYRINSGYKHLPERLQFKREISSLFNQDFSSGCTDD
jgi:predicted chitinase